MTSLSRNITLACGHPEGLATLHRDERTAFCPVCETDTEIQHLCTTCPATITERENRLNAGLCGDCLQEALTATARDIAHNIAEDQP